MWCQGRWDYGRRAERVTGEAPSEPLANAPSEWAAAQSGSLTRVHEAVMASGRRGEDTGEMREVLARSNGGAAPWARCGESAALGFGQWIQLTFGMGGSRRGMPGGSTGGVRDQPAGTCSV